MERPVLRQYGRGLEAVVPAYSGDVLAGCGHMLATASGDATHGSDGRGPDRFVAAGYPGDALQRVPVSTASAASMKQDALARRRGHAVVCGPGVRWRARPTATLVAAIDSSGCEGQLSRPVEVSAEPGSDLQIDFTVDLPDGQLTLARDAPDTPALAETVLIGCSPNPVGGEGTTISFSIGGAVGRGEVPASLTVYDAAGRVVRRLLDDTLSTGSPHASGGAPTTSGALPSPPGATSAP